MHKKSYFFQYWYLWTGLAVLFAISLIFFYFLSARNYFSHEAVKKVTLPVKILAVRSDIFSTILIANPMDNMKPYEVDLGYFCYPDKNLANRIITMPVILFKRNYNHTYYMDFPDITKKLCR